MLLLDTWQEHCALRANGMVGTEVRTWPDAPSTYNIISRSSNAGPTPIGVRRLANVNSLRVHRVVCWAGPLICCARAPARARQWRMVRRCSVPLDTEFGPEGRGRFRRPRRYLQRY